MQQLTIPPLAKGETYIGAIGNQAGDLYHLIKLPGDNDRAPQSQQLEWAKSIGGDLPTKLEAAMLFAHAKAEFKPEWYWTNETLIDQDDPEDTAYAWVQSFNYGYQDFIHKCYSNRAVAVRRLPI